MSGTADSIPQRRPRLRPARRVSSVGPGLLFAILRQVEHDHVRPKWRTMWTNAPSSPPENGRDCLRGEEDAIVHS